MSKEGIKDLSFRYIVYILGLFALSMGIVLIVKSSLGTTPISSINYVVSLHTPLSLGTCTFIINMILIVLQFIILGRQTTRRDTVEIMLQIPFSFLFAIFIDLSMWLMEGVQPTSYIGAISLVLLGCLVQSIGVVLELKPAVSKMSAEAFVDYASRRFNTEFGRFKVGFDLTLISMAVILSLLLSEHVEGVREGSLIAATLTGFIVAFLNKKIITRRNLQLIRSIFRA